MKLTNEMKIGILVSVVLLMLLTMTVKAGNFNFGRKGYTLKVRFINIDGIEKNTPVMFNGYEVGLVKAINIKEEADRTVMELDAWIEEGVNIRQGSTAHVKNMGFLGEKYVSLSAGAASAPYLSPGDLIQGEEAADMDKLLKDGQQIAAHVKQAAANISERLEKNKESIDRVIGNLDVTMVHMVSITQNVDERLKVNQTKIDDLVENLQTTSINLEEFSDDLKINPWKLLYRPKDTRDVSKPVGK